MNLKDELTKIANAIRTKLNIADKIKPSQFASKILEIEEGVEISKDLPDSSNCITSAITKLPNGLVFKSCAYAFAEFRSLAQLPNMDTSNVTNMNFMFMRCHKLTNVSLNTNKVTTMEYMFEYCSGLTQVLLSNTSNVTDMLRYVSWLYIT